MRKRLISILLLAVMLCLLAAPALAATYATIVGGWLRLRANPSYDARVITSYRSGTVVTVLSQSNGWARVLTSDYRVGYMDARYLSYGGSPVITPTPTSHPSGRTWYEVNRTAYVTSQNGRGVRLRSAPVVNNSNVMGLYPVGRTVTEIRRSSDGWSYIRIDRKYGYMMTQFLTTYSPGPAPTHHPLPPTFHPGPVVPTATPTPVPTATPTPSKQIQSVKLDPFSPTVGDTIKIIVTPSSADYTAVWYDSNNTLLTTQKTYKVRAADVGKIIYVRVMGVGESAGFVVDAYTNTVAGPAAEPESSEPEVVSEWVDDLFSTP